MKQSVLQKLKSKFQKPSKQIQQQEALLNPENPIWLKNELSRDEAFNYLIEKQIGCFVIRQSESIKDCYVLSVKVAKWINSNEISHYIIVKTKCGYIIRGFNKEFNDLKSLVTHCSFIRDMLPVLLDLNYYRQEIIRHENKLNDLYYFTSMKSSIPSTSSIGSLTSQFSLD